MSWLQRVGIWAEVYHYWGLRPPISGKSWFISEALQLIQKIDPTDVVEIGPGPWSALAAASHLYNKRHMAHRVRFHAIDPRQCWNARLKNQVSRYKIELTFSLTRARQWLAHNNNARTSTKTMVCFDHAIDDIIIDELTRKSASREDWFECLRMVQELSLDAKNQIDEALLLVEAFSNYGPCVVHHYITPLNGSPPKDWLSSLDRTILNSLTQKFGPANAERCGDSEIKGQFIWLLGTATL